ncbi:MerR family transcriptional regulator [Aquirhabdus parva]|uniref:Mercuric resistance operon regulatory protein n=1 Tax=Aquirhabdus parva TaxID=2283318 RepID=A0A345P9J7_9GAMM|nr:MerR family transcriptional regulator [Aquirhabdus parva]AXI03956.1 MerR family transcriptional regulator [Aquirhabdus parva]
MQTTTIGKLAKAAHVGIETIRYYQSRDLLPTPEKTEGYRQYPVALIERIRFIKRAQELGFSLDEISDLLSLHGNQRESIQSITAARLTQIRTKISDLQRMETVLTELLHECEHTDLSTPCPIIASIGGQRSCDNMQH